jgi:hypothetical protein
MHCNTDFTWRRYLSFSNTTLALLTAFVSVIAASAPAFRLLLTPENSSLQGVFAGISTSGDSLSMLFSNRGRRAGVINRVEVSVEYGEGKGFATYPHTEDDAAISIEPDKTILAVFLFKDAHSDWMPDSAKADLPSLGGDHNRPLLRHARCRVWARGVDADGSPYYTDMSIGCQDHAFQMFRRMLADEVSGARGEKPQPGTR